MNYKQLAIQNTQIQALLPTRSTDDMERRPQISRHSRRVKAPQTQYQTAEKPSKQVKLVSTIRSIESNEDLLSDSVERAPRVGRPRNAFTKSKELPQKNVVSPAARMKLYRSTNSMQALLPMEDRVGKIPRNKSSMRVQRTDRFVGSIRADEKVQFENMEKIEQPHIQSRPSFVALPSYAMNSIVKNNSLGREKPHTHVQSPTVTYPGANRVKSIRGSRPSFLTPGLMSSRTTVRTNHLNVCNSSPLMPGADVSDAPPDLNIHELTAFPDTVARTYSLPHVGSAQPRVEKTNRISSQKAIIRDVPTPRVTRNVFNILRRKNLRAKQYSARIRDRARILNFLKCRSGMRNIKTTGMTTRKHYPMSLTVRKTLQFLRKGRPSSCLRGNALRHLHQQIRILKQSISIRRNRQRGLCLLLHMARLHNSMFSRHRARKEKNNTLKSHSLLTLKTLELVISNLLQSLNWSKSKIASLWCGIHQCHEVDESLGNTNDILSLWNSERRNLLFI